ncbi:hypothetical protein ASZ90_007961 [hydrocarbon metagenome]|uniref:DUF937 domain-containing protein n=1 Tax=hydrocarbon metagenome TaxID=938273 RepID=A0A0W8FMQ7_9ZZZZ
MGLLSDIVSMIGKKLGGDSQQSSLMEQVFAIINNPQTGGLPGLIEKFQNNGLGDIVSSWIGTGANQPVSADQISNTLGTESINKIAGKVGVSPNHISESLASILPQLIDKLTPEGKVPDGSILEKGLSALAGKYLNR